MLERVTITGADDNTDIEDLMRLSHEYPFVEWGILVSKSNTVFVRGRHDPRYPSREWIKQLVERAEQEVVPINFSTHMCGQWVRELLIGGLVWSDIPPILRISQRVQINTHAQVHAVTTGMWKRLAEQPLKEFIFQWDGVNDPITFAAAAEIGTKQTSVLFDTSGGGGILPDRWPKPVPGLSCGFAGGLGPDNIVDQLRNIGQVAFGHGAYWIDMERRVRTADNLKLDIPAVETVLRHCSLAIGQTTGVK